MGKVLEINPTRKDAAPNEAAPVVNTPVCPHCGADPCKIDMADYLFSSGLIGLAFFCNNPACRKLLGFQAMGMAQKKPLIEVPGMNSPKEPSRL